MSNLQFAADVVDYTSAARFLGDRPSRKLAYQTWVERIDEDRVGVRHHDTTIVTYTKGLDSILLAANGWVSATTATRLHALTPRTVIVRRKQGNYIVDDAESPRVGPTEWDGITPLVIWP